MSPVSETETKRSAHPGPALLLIDFQKGFDNLDYWGEERNNPGAEGNAHELLSLWREFSLPVFHIQHCSTIPTSLLHLTNPGNSFKDLLKPMHFETVIPKNVNSAFIGTSLKEQLDRARISDLVIAGLTTDHCVSTTTRMAGNLGYTAFLVSDATAAFNRKGLDGQNYAARLIHDTALASLKDEFATLVTTKYLMEKTKETQASRIIRG